MANSSKQRTQSLRASHSARKERRTPSMIPWLMCSAAELRKLQQCQTAIHSLPGLDNPNVTQYAAEHAMHVAYRALAAHVEAIFKRYLGLETHMVIRVKTPYRLPVLFQITHFSATFGITREINHWSLSGRPLRRDGMPSGGNSSTLVCFFNARIERRLLNGTWVVIIDSIGNRA